MPTSAFNPFRLKLRFSWLSRLVECVLGLRPFIRFYDNKPQNISSHEFLDYALDTLDVSLTESSAESIANIVPKQGALLIACNHPLGGLEGIVLTRELLKHRQDVKVLTNQLLTRVPEYKDIFVGVDILSPEAQRNNRDSIRLVNEHVKNGGVLLIFPAGKVASYQFKLNKITDFPWNNMVGTLMKKHKLPCLPIFVEGRNSILFYILSFIHPIFRPLMLIRELPNKKGARLNINVGEIIAPDSIANFNSTRDITQFVRLNNDLLALHSDSPSNNDFVDQAPIDLALANINAKQLIPSLEPFHLITHKNFQVYCVPFDKLGSFMPLIGQAREHTFREVNEGTGKAVDSDRFDPHYHHLFAWDQEKEQIVGGYRIGFVDQIIKSVGIDGLYTRSLYNYEQSFLDGIGQCLELGRSFITPQYQRHPTALDILWKGIGAVVAKNPQYRTLFGAVSVSSEYSALARAFISESMLTTFRAEQIYIDQVSPKTPLVIKGRVWNKEILSSINKISVINHLVGCCDPGKKVPILLRQYIALNGRFITFTVNKGFNDALDGMILLNLLDTPEKYMNRYLGKQGFVDFQRFNAEIISDKMSVKDTEAQKSANQT